MAAARKPKEQVYYRHKSRPAWGLGVIVEENSETKTFLFADGSKRAFKSALVEEFIERSAEPPADEDQARLTRGLATKGKATPKAINLELEAQIVASPDDPGPYLVYADWLQTKLDPRGGLIIIQHQLAADPANKKLRDAEKQLLETQGKYLMPESLHDMLRLPRRAATKDRSRCEAIWRLGFLEHVHLAKRPRQEGDIDGIATDLLLHPSSHFLRALTIGALGTPESYSYIPVVTAIARAKHPLLEEVVIGDFGSDLMDLAFSRAGNVAPLISSLPALKRIKLRSGALRFDSNIKHPKLESLCIIASELTSASTARIARAACPSLVSLEVSAPNVSFDQESLTELFSQKGLPNLTRLAIRQSSGTMAILEALLASPPLFLRSLQTLEVTDGDLADKDVPKLVKHAARFTHLKKIDLSGAKISAKAIGQLKALGKGMSATPRANELLITEAQVAARSPDAKSVAAARAIAKPAKWLTLGRDGARLWGEYEGQDHYYVLARLDNETETSCTCASPKDPCKHALALLLLAATGYEYAIERVPDTLVRQTRDRPQYYNSFWE